MTARCSRTLYQQPGRSQHDASTRLKTSPTESAFHSQHFEPATQQRQMNRMAHLEYNTDKFRQVTSTQAASSWHQLVNTRGGHKRHSSDPMGQAPKKLLFAQDVPSRRCRRRICAGPPDETRHEHFVTVLAQAIRAADPSAGMLIPLCCS